MGSRGFLQIQLYVFIFRDSSGIAFYNFYTVYLHDLKPQVVDLLLEGPVL